VRLGDGVAAVAVCADIGRPSHPESAAKRGARTYLASMFVIPPDFESDTAKLRSYAMRHSMAVLLANYGGPSGGLPSAGGSAIWSEKGELLAQLGATGDGLVVAIEGPDGWRARAVGAAC
jgi:predicted amidohydrolase